MDTTSNKKYAYRIEWSEDDQEHVGLCLEFPGLSWLEKSPEKSLKGIQKLVDEVVSCMIEDKENIPEPLSCKKYSGKFMVRIPPEEHRDLVMSAADSGVSLNRLVSMKLSKV